MIQQEPYHFRGSAVFNLNILCEMRTHKCKILNNSVKNPMTSDRNLISIFGCKITDLWGWRDGSIVRTLGILPEVRAQFQTPTWQIIPVVPQGPMPSFGVQTRMQTNTHTHKIHMQILKKNTDLYSFQQIIHIGNRNHPEDKVRRCGSPFLPQTI